jgi:methyltransferase
MRDTRIWFVGLVILMIVERLAELAVSARHARRLRARGGVEHGAAHYPAMVALHSGLVVAAPMEVFLAGRPFLPWVGLPAIVLLATTLLLRYWAIATLGDRWCTRVIVPPGEPPIAAGPYRFLRHPNYLAVALEVPALALVHTAWLTALVFGALNLAMLRVRIRVEDAALGRRAGDGA